MKKKIEILIIEDNPDDLFFIKKAIDPDKYHCHCIESGKEAYEFLRSPSPVPEIVFIDYMLTEMNGLEILKKLNDEALEYSYIFLTVDNSINTVVEAMKLGALDFLVKSTSLKSELPEKLEKVYTIHRNRIEKKNMEEQLILAKNIAEGNVVKYQTLVDAAFDSILVTTDGTILEVNKKAIEISGYTYKELMGISATELAVGGGEDIKKYLKFHDGKDYETKVRKKDGTILTVIVNSKESVINGKTVRISSVRDITESRLMEKKLREAEKMSAIGQLAGGIAHDFNNQLSPIIGYADMLSHKLENPQYKKFAQNILQSAIRSADLTKKILSFARKGQLFLEKMDVIAKLKDILDLFEAGIDKKITIKREIGIESVFINADTSQFEHSLMNILINARDAMTDGGDLTVRIELTSVGASDELCIYNHLYEGDYVKITISDSGSGIPEELKKNIFEPFFTTKEVGQGTGMGLASAYGAIKEHEGYISFSSEEGKGTDFYIYLPFPKENTDTKGQNPSQFEGDKAVKSCILVIDDEKMLCSMLEDVLESDNHTIESCSSGKEALEIFSRRDTSFDLVLLDMVMPEMDGYETFMHIKELDPDCKVVISSGYNMRKEFKKLKEEGVVGFLHKPYKIGQLRKLLKSILG